MSGGCLTARTLNNEVLPAFCRPIIVISISVALPSGDLGQHHIAVAARELPRRGVQMGAQNMLPDTVEKTDQNSLSNQSYTRLNSPAMVIRSQREIEDCPRSPFWGEQLPGSCARLEGEEMGRRRGW